MPTYDYECAACGHHEEIFQTFSEKPRRKCPSCGTFRFKRLIGSGAGVIFKGSGFHETDYRSDSYKAGARKEKKKNGGCTGDPGSCDGPCSTASSDKPDD